MAEAPPEFRLGRIIWAYLRPSTTGPKAQHPAVIISPTAEIVQPDRLDPRADLNKDNSVAVVGVSTKYKNYPNLAHFVLPSHPDRHAVTKLKTACAAMIGWYDVVVIPDEVDDLGGDVPPEMLAEIDRAVRADLVAQLGAGFANLSDAISELVTSPRPTTRPKRRR